MGTRPRRGTEAPADNRVAHTVNLTAMFRSGQAARDVIEAWRSAHKPCSGRKKAKASPHGATGIIRMRIDRSPSLNFPFIWPLPVRPCDILSWLAWRVL